uniref:Alpha-macroglobulin receptor-binding domain-containing protein n=1 Tax=Electrophorus electricus TaxID=8005 RepID=A0A4W4F6Z6_ELEEL
MFAFYLLFLHLYFMVTFPAVIESGSEAKLCVSLLRPNETLQMTIYLIHNNHSRTLVEETVEEEFHRCSQFKAPEVDGQSLQEIKVQVKGESFEMTKKSRVLFKSYSKLTFIQTDKPIYNPGQTVNFRVVAMDSNFVPLEQKYSAVTLEDNNNNRIGQWMNVSSSGLILQLSHKLNSEAPQGLYKLKANIGNKLTEHHFKVKKYVLPKFEVTIKAPEQQSVGEEELKLEICGKYTYRQPVSGKALLRVCRPFWRYAYYEDVPMISLCLTETLSRTGCAFPSFNISTFMNTEMESNLQDSLAVTATVTEEGTAISMVKSENIQLTFQIGKVEFLDLPKTFERGTILEGKIKLTNFRGRVIPNKTVYIFTEGSDGSSTVTVKSAGGDSHRFDVHQNNKLLYQEKPLQDVPGKYSIDVKGSTCVSVQVALFYNIPTPTETSTLHIKAEIEGNCTKSFRNTLSLFVSVIYNGTLPSTNMVIVDIKLLSGFTADPSALKNSQHMERVDSKADHIIMYIKEVPRNIPMYYQLFINQVLPVQNLKPAVIKVYDYYQTSDQSETEYSSPCV